MFSILNKLLFPAFCCHCGHIGSYLCQKCYEQLDFLGVDDQLGLPELNVISMARLTGPMLSLIHALKYGANGAVAETLAQLLYLHTSVPDCDVLVPVPMHWYKKWQRGYNQAEEIALHLGKVLDKPVMPLLTRISGGKSQASVKSKEDRLLRFRHTFCLNPALAGLKLTKTRILLVDDVVTTGSTLMACAQILQAHESRTTTAITVAHGK